MLEFQLPQDVTLSHEPSGAEGKARIIRLTRQIAADRIDGAWWNVQAPRAAREAEDDHHWQWRKIVGELRNQGYWEALAVETEDHAIQGAIVYRTDASSRIELGKGTVFGERLATAPRNRPWLVNPPRLRGVGRILLLAAVRHSHLLGLGGRVGLASLATERTAGFYANRGFQVINHDFHGIINMELPEARAVEWLEEEGYL